MAGMGAFEGVAHGRMGGASRKVVGFNSDAEGGAAGGDARAPSRGAGSRPSTRGEQAAALAVYGVGEGGGADALAGREARPASRGRQITGSTRRSAAYHVSGSAGRPLPTMQGHGAHHDAAPAGSYAALVSSAQGRGSRPNTSGANVPRTPQSPRDAPAPSGTGLSGGLSSARRGRTRLSAAADTLADRLERTSLSRSGSRANGAHAADPRPPTREGASTSRRGRRTRGEATARRDEVTTHQSLEDYLLGPSTPGGSDFAPLDIPEDPTPTESSIDDGDLSPSALPISRFGHDLHSIPFSGTRHDLRPATVSVQMQGHRRRISSGTLPSPRGVHRDDDSAGGTREVDLSSLSAELFSPKPHAQGRSHSARNAGEAGSLDQDRPPSRQRPPPESLHLFGIGKRIDTSVGYSKNSAARPTTSHVVSRPGRPMSGPGGSGRPPTRDRGGDHPMLERRPPPQQRLPDASRDLAAVRGRQLTASRSGSDGSGALGATRPPATERQAIFHDIFGGDSDGEV